MLGRSVAVLFMPYAAARRVQTQTKMGLEPVDLNLNCNDNNLRDVIACEDPAPKALGSGSFGQAWFVRSKVNIPELERTGGMMVMKTFFTTDERNEFVTGTHGASGNIAKLLEEARSECEMARSLHKAQSSSRGSENFIHCYGHNFDKGDNSTPLYMLMDFAGRHDLAHYAAKEVLLNETLIPEPVPFLLSVFKQVLTGLDFLANLRPVTIHHDLKSENVVVNIREGKGGKKAYTAQLIDLGAMTQATEETWCQFKTSSPAYAPPEFLSTEGRCYNSVSFAKNAPAAFDVYSAGVMWVEMLTGLTSTDLLLEVNGLWCKLVKQTWCKVISKFDPSSREKETEFGRVNCIEESGFCSKQMLTPDGFPTNLPMLFRLRDAKFFWTTMLAVVEEVVSPKRAHFVSRVLKDEAMLSFTKLCMEVLTADAAARPTAKQMLEHEVMTRVEDEPETETGKEDKEALAKEVTRQALADDGAEDVWELAFEPPKEDGLVSRLDQDLLERTSVQEALNADADVNSSGEDFGNHGYLRRALGYARNVGAQVVGKIGEKVGLWW